MSHVSEKSVVCWKVIKAQPAERNPCDSSSLERNGNGTKTRPTGIGSGGGGADVHHILQIFAATSSLAAAAVTDGHTLHTWPSLRLDLGPLTLNNPFIRGGCEFSVDLAAWPWPSPSYSETAIPTVIAMVNILEFPI
ncbi:hypothetical protein J6590_008727 [Homalodisca vitripennis]|nr:hypothetical protein J6590_008727 [Homalodisca vitripennis]